MEICKCNDAWLLNMNEDDICVRCHKIIPATVSQLQARIAELEMELKKQKAAAEKGETLLKVMWGDNFNDDSLH